MRFASIKTIAVERGIQFKSMLSEPYFKVNNIINLSIYLKYEFTSGRDVIYEFGKKQLQMRISLSPNLMSKNI